ncbi:MAG: hypothetical protein J6W79_00430 [Alphaproteobacteria bacterium]|nr:hypothetical protein [Alphaproteobacteria bacterium]
MTYDDIQVYDNGRIATAMKLTPAEEHIVDYIADVACIKTKTMDADQIAYNLSKDLTEHFSVLDTPSRFRDWVNQKCIEFKRVYRVELDKAELFKRFDRYSSFTETPVMARYKMWKTNNEKKLKEIMADKSLSPNVKASKIAHIQEIITNLNQGMERQKNLFTGRTR